MEFAIPISRFDPTHVHWGEPRISPYRRSIPFGYDDNQMRFSSLITVLEPLRVVHIDWEKNQLILEDVGQISFLSKFEQLQQLINLNIQKHYKNWLEGTTLLSPTNINQVQPWVKGGAITLYLSEDPSLLSFYTENGKTQFSEKNVKPGDLIRVVVRLNGISLQMTNTDNWTGKSRIQHHIIELYKVSASLQG